MNFGKIVGEPIDVYHGQAGDCISSTRLKTFMRSALLYWKLHVAKTLPKPEKTPALIFGSAVDTLTFDGPDAFNRAFILEPEDAPKRPTKAQLNAAKPSPAAVASMTFWSQFDKYAAGKEVLAKEDMDTVKRCVDALHSNKTFAEMLAAGKSQVTFRLKGQPFNTQVRPDLWLEEGCDFTRGESTITDLKTIVELPCDDADFLPRHVLNFGYHLSAFLYREVVATVLGYKPGFRPRFYLTFVEKQEPFAVVTRQVDEVALLVAEKELRLAIERLTACMNSNHWPDTWDEPGAPISVPDYYVRKVLGNQTPNSNLWG